MTVYAGTVKAVELLRAPDDAVTGETTTALYCAAIYFDHGAQHVTTSDTMKLTSATTAISGARKDGKTVTLRFVSCYRNAYNATDAAILSLKSVAISTADITFAPTTSDYSTAADIPAASVLSRPFAVYVAYSVA